MSGNILEKIELYTSESGEKRKKTIGYRLDENENEITVYEIDEDNNDLKQDKPIQPEPTEQDIVNAEILLSNAEIMSKLVEQDEVQAEILLNQMEG